MSLFNWGILGTGNIAGSMADALGLVPDARRYAVASRSEGKARAFAARWGFDNAYGSYGELLADPAVDIVYVGTPNACHKDNILSALSAGKHVLCEKPMTLSEEDSEACFAAADRAGLLLVEALWTAFFPAMQKAVDLVRSGEIGTPRYLNASFVSFRDPKMHPNLFDPTLGGGARNDLGIYPVAAALLLAGPVVSSRFESVIGPTGVDEMVAMSLRHQNGALSQLAFGFRAEMPIAVQVVGDRGSVEIPRNFHHPQSVTLRRNGVAEVLDLPSVGKGYAHEAMTFHGMLTGQCTGPSPWPSALTLESARLLAEPDHLQSN